MSAATDEWRKWWIKLREMEAIADWLREQEAQASQRASEWIMMEPERED